MSYIVSKVQQKALRHLGISDLKAGSVIDLEGQILLKRRIAEVQASRRERASLMQWGVIGTIAIIIAFFVLTTWAASPRPGYVDAARMKAEADEARYAAYRQQREWESEKYLNDLQDAVRYAREHGGY